MHTWVAGASHGISSGRWRHLDQQQRHGGHGQGAHVPPAAAAGAAAQRPNERRMQSGLGEWPPVVVLDIHHILVACRAACFIERYLCAEMCVVFALILSAKDWLVAQPLPMGPLVVRQPMVSLCTLISTKQQGKKRYTMGLLYMKSFAYAIVRAEVWRVSGCAERRRLWGLL